MRRYVQFELPDGELTTSMPDGYVPRRGEDVVLGGTRYTVTDHPTYHLADAADVMAVLVSLGDPR